MILAMSESILNKAHRAKTESKAKFVATCRQVLIVGLLLSLSLPVLAQTHEPMLDAIVVGPNFDFIEEAMAAAVHQPTQGRYFITPEEQKRILGTLDREINDKKINALDIAENLAWLNNPTKNRLKKLNSTQKMEFIETVRQIIDVINQFNLYGKGACKMVDDRMEIRADKPLKYSLPVGIDCKKL
jgi:hypothetical protein